MKKLFYILLLLVVFSCTDDTFEILEPVTNSVDIFEVQSTVVNDGDEININLVYEGEFKI